MNLSDNLLRGVYSYGFEIPSEVQKRAIVPISQGKDVLVQAQSGTGKTATFVIGSLQKVLNETSTENTSNSLSGPKILVLCNSRELAKQTYKVFCSIGQYLDYRVGICIGGLKSGVSSEDKDIPIHAVPRNYDGCTVVVGTLGRVIDSLQRGQLDFSNLSVVIVDEADEMFDKSYDQLTCVFKDGGIGQSVQLCVVSATLPTEVSEKIESWLSSPLIIKVKKEQLTLLGIKQFYVEVPHRHKLEALIDLYDKFSVAQTIIYCNKRSTVEWLRKKLEQNDFTVSITHGELSSMERSRVINEFRNGKSRILITTDLLARGIDVQQVSLVVNYDLPNEKETYIHRIGRSGRFGRKGVAINFVDPAEMDMLKNIQSFYSTQISLLPQDVSSIIVGY